MKLPLLILALLLHKFSFSQNVMITTTDAKEINTNIRAIGSGVLYTSNGNFDFAKMSTVSFETKEEKDQGMYARLEGAGVKIVFTNAPIIIDQGAREQGDSHYVQNRQYRWGKVKVKLANGKTIKGQLLSVTEDSLLVHPFGKGTRGVRQAIGYSEISFVGIHKKGAGAVGAFIGGIIGGLCGAAIGSHKADNSINYSGTVNFVLDAVGGIVIGAIVGGSISSSNEKHHINGDREQFVFLIKEIAKTEP